jgi:hypothetical protein
MGGQAGKGDDPRSVDKKKYDENFVKIFGEKDPMDFHKDKKSETKPS